MALDPQAKALLDMLVAAGGPPIEQMEVPAVREMYLAMRPPTAGPEVARVEDRRIPGANGAEMGGADRAEIGIRIYTPRGGDAPFPIIVYFHGGGWVIGDLETHDAWCRALASGAGALVVAVDYRLAPEERFPAAAEDCFAATQWVAANAAALGGDPARLAVAGDSAGGNLAAVVAQLARDRGGPPIAFQLLLCPATDYGFATTSYRENADGYLLTKNGMAWFWHHYLPDPAAQGRDPRASPMRARSFAGLPPAHVVTAEYDPLRDEGEAYAARLREAGVPVTAKRYDGQIHNFFTMGHVLSQGAAAADELCGVLRRALGTSAAGAQSSR
jgi:acetyl esterase